MDKHIKRSAKLLLLIILLATSTSHKSFAKNDEGDIENSKISQLKVKNAAKTAQLDTVVAEKIEIIETPKPVETVVSPETIVASQVEAQTPVVKKANKKPKPTVAKKPVSTVKNTGVVRVGNTAVNYPQLDKEYVKQRICAVFTSNCAEALKIAFHESGYRTNAISSTNDYGVFQINCRWQKHRVGGDCTKYFDLETNIKIAKQIYNEQGWNPWTTKKYL